MMKAAWMWKRCRYWLLLVALLGVALAVYFEPTRCVRGWLWGEAFFDGRPTSYWRNITENILQRGTGWSVSDDEQRAFPLMRICAPSWQERLVDAMYSVSGWKRDDELVIDMVRATESQHVLNQLSKDSNPNLAGFAMDVSKFRQQHPDLIAPATNPFDRARDVFLFIKSLKLIQKHRIGM